MGRALLIAVVVLCALVPTTAEAATSLDVRISVASAQSDLVGMINAYRSANGIQQVIVNQALTNAAGWMANDMASRNYLSHTSSDGRTPTQRMSAFGYPASTMYTGEDLGAGYQNAAGVLGGWKASPPHDAVLLNPSYDAIGVGLVFNPNTSYKWFWVADFGGPGGTKKVVVPPPPPAPPAPVRAVPPPAPVTPAAPVAPRVAAVARGAEPQRAVEAIGPAPDPEAVAAARRQAFSAELGARRIVHLIAKLTRMGLL